jgi:hypothetical protein
MDMEPLDLKKLAAEVSAHHDIRIDADDPMMVVMTLNRLVFEHAVDEAVSRLKTSADDIERAAGRVQVRAGTALAQDIKEYSATIALKTTAAIDSIVLMAGRRGASPPRFLNARTFAIVFLWAVATFLAGIYVGTVLTGTGPGRI